MPTDPVTTTSAKPYLREAELALLLGVSIRTIRNWMRRGVLPYRRVGRVIIFKRDEVEVALARYRINEVC